MTQTTNHRIWRELYEKSNNIMQHPDSAFVTLFNRNFSSGEKYKILDFGFGGGANLRMMCSKGHHLYGAEISQEVIKYNEERLKESGLKAHLVNLDSDVIPFPDGHFDAISAWHVLGYNNLDSLKTTTSEFHRVIKSGGRILGTIPAYGDVSHVSAKMLNSNEFVSNVGGQKGAHIICLETADDVSLALGWDANAIKIDLMQIPLLNGFVSRHWVFIYIKP